MKTPTLPSMFAVAGFCSCLCSFALSARAEAIYAISNNDNAIFNLVSFDSATPGTTTSNVTITGITGVLSSIDFRPSNGQLYGVSYQTVSEGTPTAQLYSINTATGVATTIGSAFSLTGASSSNLRVGIDFNPAADRLRVVAASGSDGFTTTSYRVNADTGGATADTALSFAPGDPNTGSSLYVKGIAYSNNFAGATMTTLYGYEFSRDIVGTIGSPNGMPTSPNTGQFFTLGNSGISAGFDVGFDISGLTGIGYISAFNFIDEETDDGDSPFPGFRHFLEGLKDPLWTVNLATGQLTFVGDFDGALNITDIAVAIPEPGTLTLAGVGAALGAAAAIRRVRRRRAQS